MENLLPLVPQNLDAERYLLGAVLLSGNALDDAAEIVSGHDFFKPLHGTLFDILVELRASGEPLDPLLIIEKFSSGGRSGSAITVAWLRSLSVDVPSTQNIVYYAEIVAALALRRRLIDAAATISALAHDPTQNQLDVLNGAEQLIYDLGQNIDTRGGWFRDLVPTVRAGLDEPLPTRTTTGFAQLDSILSGFTPGDLILLAARPAVGKSTLALQIAAHAARNHGPVMFFSLEMSPTNLIERLLSEQGQVAHERVRAHAFEPHDPERLDQAAKELAALPLWVDDRASTVAEIQSQCRRQTQNSGQTPALVVIDYLQLLQSNDTKTSRYEQVTALSRDLKRTAMDLGVPILALCQLNRSPEQRHDQRPILADLRDSGSLEQDADTVLFLYPVLDDDTDDVVTNLVTLAVAKNRNGPTGTLPLLFIRRLCQFSSHTHESPK